MPDHRWTFTTQAQAEAPSGITFDDEVGDLIATLRRQRRQAHRWCGGLARQHHRQPASLGDLRLPRPAERDRFFDTERELRGMGHAAFLKELAACSTSAVASLHSGTNAAAGEIVDGATAPGATAGYDNLSLTFNNAANMNSQQLEGQYDGNAPQYSFSTTPIPQQARRPLCAGGGRQAPPAAKRAGIATVSYKNTADFPFHITDMEDVNNWIGRSMYAAIRMRTWPWMSSASTAA